MIGFCNVLDLIWPAGAAGFAQGLGDHSCTLNGSLKLLGSSGSGRFCRHGGNCCGLEVSFSRTRHTGLQFRLLGTCVIIITASYPPVLCLFRSKPSAPSESLSLSFAGLQGSEQSGRPWPYSRHIVRCLVTRHPMIASLTPSTSLQHLPNSKHKLKSKPSALCVLGPILCTCQQ